MINAYEKPPEIFPDSRNTNNMLILERPLAFLPGKNTMALQPRQFGYYLLNLGSAYESIFVAKIHTFRGVRCIMRKNDDSEPGIGFYNHDGTPIGFARLRADGRGVLEGEEPEFLEYAEPEEKGLCQQEIYMKVDGQRPGEEDEKRELIFFEGVRRRKQDEKRI